MEVRAARIQGTTLVHPTHLFFPSKMTFEEGHVTTVERKWFGLGKAEDDVRIDRVASVRIDSGIFNSTITVETQGGATRDLQVKTVPKKKAIALVAEIRAALP